MSYIIHAGSPDSNRLEILADSNFAETIAFLRKFGAGQDSRILDVGCGSGSISRRLVAALDPSHPIVGVDRDASAVANAEAETAASPHAGRVVFAVLDLETGDPEALVASHGPFDVVFARYVLSHCSRTPLACANLLALVRPGGVLLLEDIDFGGRLAHPPCAAFDRYGAWYQETARRRGADSEMGRKLLRVAMGLGLEGVEVGVSAPCYTHGPAKTISLLTLRAISASVVAAGVATEAEVRDADAQLAEFIADPTTILAPGRTFRAAGRKPRPADA